MTELSDRMRAYEQQETSSVFMEHLPILARMDGRAFHRFANKLQRPYDAVFHQMMIETAATLLWETGAQIGYTTSDEITLCWTLQDPKYQMMFGSNKQKLISSLASMTTAFFELQKFRHDSSVFIENIGAPCTFDARVWTVPNVQEALNNFQWRESETIKNSILASAKTLYSQKELKGITSDEQQKMMWVKGLDWSDYPSAFKRGTYLIKDTITINFNAEAEDIEKLPLLHEVRKNPNLEVLRNVVKTLELPPLDRITNLEEVLLHGLEPITVE
jgi:tRNA(His) 5'-end guanylyltransferase